MWEGLRIAAGDEGVLVIAGGRVEVVVAEVIINPSWCGRRCNHGLDWAGRFGHLVLVFVPFSLGVVEVIGGVLRRLQELGKGE